MPKPQKMTAADYLDEAKRLRRAASVASCEAVRQHLLSLAMNYEGRADRRVASASGAYPD
jgi:hypothetical protein